MGFIDKFRSLFRRETRAINGEATWLPAPALSGVIVDSGTATHFGCFFAGVSVLSSDIAKIPFQLVKRQPNGGRLIDYGHPLHEIICHEPNGETDAVGFFQACMWHLLTHGNAFSEIQRDEYLNPVALHLLDPRHVRVERTRDHALFYEVDGKRFLSKDVLHFKNVSFDGIVGASVIQHARETLGLSMAVEKFGASYFGNGVNAKGILTTEQRYDEVADKNLRAQINNAHQGPYNANKPLLLWNGLTFQQTSIPAEDAQFLQTRQFQVEEICRILNIPPTKLQKWDKASYATLEESNASYYTDSLLPWVRRLESEMSRKLLTREERRVYSIEHDTGSSTRGKTVERATANKILFEMGSKSPNEVRAEAGLPPIQGGDSYFVPLNFAPLDKVSGASIQTLKGVKEEPKATEAIPDSPTDALDVPVLVADGAIAAARDVVLDVLQRMVTRETKAVRRMANKDHEALCDALDGFYATEAETLAGALSPALRLYGALTGRSYDPQAIAKDQVARSTQAIVECIESDDCKTNLTNLIGRWSETKALEILESLSNERNQV